jgi:diguanylate cyclase
MNGVLYWALFGFLVLAAGGGVGFGVAALRYANALQSQQAANAVAQGMLQNLERIAAKINADVGQHSVVVQGIDRQLATAAADPGGGDDIRKAATDLATANERLQTELGAAREELDAQAQKLRKREEEARTDGLTMLLNRRSFDEAVDALVKEVFTGSQTGALLMLDIDHFKQFNDKHGHQVGDTVLKHVARTLRQTLLGTDAIVARYGGEEFAVILPAAKAGGEQRLVLAKALASQIRSAIEASVLSHEGQSLSVRVSIGLAVAMVDVTKDQLVSRADEALYAAKKAGRNRCYYHTAKACLPVEGVAEAGTAAGRQHPPPPTAAIADSKAEKALAPGVVVPETNENKVPSATPLSSTPEAATAGKGGRERRKHERKSCNGVHLVAPCPDGCVPAKDKFFRVQFCDISAGGFAMMLSAPPPIKRYVVVIKKPAGAVFMGADVMNVRESKEMQIDGKPMIIVGCKFTQRIPLASELAAATQTAAT